MGEVVNGGKGARTAAGGKHDKSYTLDSTKIVASAVSLVGRHRSNPDSKKREGKAVSTAKTRKGKPKGGASPTETAEQD